MVVLVRHDVDDPFSVHILNYLHFKFPHLYNLPRYLEAEIVTARLEKLYRIRATYFFRPKYTIPSCKLLEELRDEDMFEIALHPDRRSLIIQKSILERATGRRVYGASSHGSRFGILAPADGYRGASSDRIREAGLEYYDGINVKGELVPVDRIFRGIDEEERDIKWLKQRVLKHADVDSGPLKLLIHGTYVLGYGLYRGYGIYVPIRKDVESLFQFIHEERVKTLTYHQYVAKNT